LGIITTNLIRIRWVVISVICLPAIAGAVGLIYVPRSNIHGLMASYYVCYMFPALRESPGLRSDA
jgi:hypothetical protein